jgi:hypothetical protein
MAADEYQNVEQFLDALFSADPGARDYNKKFPAYKYDSLIPGWKPWWPSVAELWRWQGDPGGCMGAVHWPPAWDALRKLHAEYVAARDARRSR